MKAIKIFCEDKKELERKKQEAVRNGWYVFKCIHYFERKLIEVHFKRMDYKVVYWTQIKEE